ncbi:MAG: hypothetical protein J0I47_14845 [Sphingomonas sp.]|nr:hypothetical protein [Sphingomonas sp.]
MIGVILALGVIETTVVHLVASVYWGWKVALPLGAIDLAMIVALVALLVSFRRCPVELTDTHLTMRAGRRRTVSIPIDRIAGFRASWSQADVKARDVANLALVAWPNVFIDLTEPVRTGRRVVSGVAHKLDDPVAFRAAIDRAIANQPSTAAPPFAVA